MDTYMRSIDELRLIAESRKTMIKLLLWMLLIAVIIIASMGFVIIDNKNHVEQYISKTIEYRYADLIYKKNEAELKYDCLMKAIDFCTEKELENEINRSESEIYWMIKEEGK